VPELEQELKDHLAFLKTSLDLFEESEREAKRLSVSLRVLFHQTAQSHSLVHQMGADDSLRFPECAAPRNAFAYWQLSSVTAEVSQAALGAMPYQGLVAKELTSEQGRVKLRFVPLYMHPQFDVDDHRKVDFATWWDAIVCDYNGNEFSRKDLVLATANKFGGAHVDPNPSSKHVSLKNRSFLNLETTGTIVESDTIPLYAAVAQIAHEALQAW
jgi:hypothetical protein